MLLRILLPSLLLSLTNAGADATSPPKTELEGLENLVEKLQFRLRNMELRLEETEMRMKSEKETQAKEKKEMEARLESKDEEMETRLEELGDKMKADRALAKPSLRDLPIVIISAWQPNTLRSPQTVTFESFLANYNNGERPGGGDGVLDLDSGIFTCMTPGYYTVSFSAQGWVGPSFHYHQLLYLYKNGVELPESSWVFWKNEGALNTNIGGTSSRNVVSNLLPETCQM